MIYLGTTVGPGKLKIKMDRKFSKFTIDTSIISFNLNLST
jgi:hypothetical protein